MINKNTLFLLALICIVGSCPAQQKKSSQKQYAIAFYNVENLFDIYNDPKTHDDDFTPKGSYRYSERIYKKKLHNIAIVLSQLDNGKAPSIVGLAEVENKRVLKDLINQPELKKYNLKYCWYDSPDPRGIDVALLYQPNVFKVLESDTKSVTYNGSKNKRFRDILYVKGTIQKDTLHLLVNHWPSRREGVKASAPKRAAAAKVNRDIANRLIKENSNSKIIIMGDMNDNPTDASITTTLRASGNKKAKGKLTLYNPWTSKYKSGEGTSVYHKQWDHFDQIIISKGLLYSSGLRLSRANIFDEDFIRNQKYGSDGYPFRSFKGRQFINGYSDHFPILIYLK